ncbi:TIGR04219 family outer membrane beta-barrel protein [Thalassolituus hydrocarboniclasticus]|uniref:TIGR04219 family outer membrane beta-barrel protein n=1 Tax=Thalassolituus hydrocarboniclasticus TaxID=2742796 RepID=A0ABY6ADG2_9GAMM|nr:TIGR04219 family outer membrane beta-barrel protein [Thalassolituus hydrocarboniclasticus]UXD87880.1 TIGR04219 family outer membrane beta-barrel protein [Thalassolituus hydrocarboniclasticus]
MKKTAIAAFLLAMTPVAAQADLLFTVGAKASVWNAEAGGQIDEGVSVEKDGLNLDSDNGQQLTVFFEHPLPFIPNLKLKQTSLELEGDGNINAQFADQTFNEDVSSKLDLSHSDLTLYWGLPLPVPFVDVNFGLTARQFDGVAEVSGKTTSVNESVDLDFVMPLVYGEVKIDSPFGLYASADINYIGMGGNKLSDISYGIGYDLPVPVVDIGLEAGYRSINLKADKDLADIDTDFDVSGAYFGASLALGF